MENLANLALLAVVQQQTIKLAEDLISVCSKEDEDLEAIQRLQNFMKIPGWRENLARLHSFRKKRRRSVA